jgi:beta-lactamase regulating signal transducer with metallopeptidase domain
MPALESIEYVVSALWRASWQASILVLLVLLAQGLMRKRLSPAWCSALWLLVVVRLLLPATPPTGWSLFNLTERLVPSAISSSEPIASLEAQVTDWSSTSQEPWHEPASPWSHPALSDETLLSREWPTPIAQPVADPTGPQSSIDWIATAFWIWLAGVIGMGTWLAWGTATFARRIRCEPAVREPRTLALLDDCRAVMGTSAPLKLVETDQVDSPALFGFRRLILLLPTGTIRRLKPSELRHVFLHELAHMRRGDVLLNWLTTFLQVLHWFNPVIWFAFARMRADREMACDAMALERGGSSDRAAYGATILKLVSGLNSTRPAPGLVGISERKTNLKRRIRMIASHRKPRRGSFLAMMILVTLGLVSLTDARATREVEEPGDAGNRVVTKNKEAAETVAEEKAFQQREAVMLLRRAVAKGSEARQEGDLVVASRFYEEAYRWAHLAGVGIDTEHREVVSYLVDARLELASRAQRYGDFHEARLHVDRVLAVDPNNEQAMRLKTENDKFLQGVDQPEVMDKEKGAEVADAWPPHAQRDRLPTPNPFTTTSLASTAPGRQAIQSKLHQIVLDEVMLQGVTLPDVLDFLRQATQARDPDRHGINFLINPNVVVPLTPDPLVDPTTGELIPPTPVEPVDMNSVRIQIVPPLRKIRLSDLLDAIVRVASHPIRYSIEDFGIVFSQTPPDESLQLETRIFRVNPKTFVGGLYSVGSFPLGDRIQEAPGGAGGAGGIGGGGLPGVTSTNLTQNSQEIVRGFFLAAGINVLPPNQIYYNDRKGVLMVRATPRELDIVQQAVEVLSEAPPQISFELLFKFELLFVEITRGDATDPELDRINGAGEERVVTGVLTENQFKVVLRELENRPGVRMASRRRITTLSGRTTLIGHELPDGSPVGIELLPVVQSNGYDIELPLRIRAGSGSVELDESTGLLLPSWDPKERHIVTSTAAVLRDGQTVVVGGLRPTDFRPPAHREHELQDHPVVGQLFRGESADAQGQLLLFITPTLIDPAGNPLHASDRLPFDPNTIPDQT